MEVHHCKYLLYLVLFYTLDYSLKHILMDLHLIHYNQKKVIATASIFLVNSTFYILCHSFLLNTCECLIYHQLQ